MSQTPPDATNGYGYGYGQEAAAQQEKLLSPWYYIYILRKRVLLILSFAVLGVVLGVVIVANTTPKYEAKAQLLFSVGPPSGRGEVVNKDYAGEGLSTIWEQDSYLATQLELLQGRSLAEAVVQRLHLKDSPEFRAGPPGLLHRVRSLILGKKGKQENTEKSVAASTSALVSMFLDRVGAKRTGPGKSSISRIVEVTFEGSNPDEILKILNTMLDVFRQQDIERRYKAVSEVLAWLQEKQRDAQAAVQSAEAKIQEYIEKENLVVVPQQFRGEAPVADQEKLNHLNTAIVEASSRRIQTELLYQAMEKMIAQNKPLPGEDQNPVLQELNARCASLETKYAALSERFGDKWPEIRDIKAEMSAVKDQIAQERKKTLDAARESYDLANRQEEKLRQALEEEKAKTIELRRKAVVYKMLKGESQANEQLFEMLIENTKEANIAQSIDRSQIGVVTPAYIGGEKSVSRAKKKALALVLMFLVGGFGLAFVLETFNPTIRIEEEAEDGLGIPLLGSIMEVGKDALSNNGRLIPLLPCDSPESVYMQQLQRIIINAFANGLSHDKATLLITSGLPQEGKSFMAANLSACLAKAGKNVLLIDADVYQPKQHTVFGAENGTGLLDILESGNGSVCELAKTEIPNLSLLAAGRNRAGYAAIPFHLDRMKAMLEGLKEEFDIIVLDGSPLGVVADSLSLSQVVDWVVLVVRSGTLSRSTARRLIREIEHANANLLGAVLNSTPGVRGYRDYYYRHPYCYYYEYQGAYGAHGKGKRRREKKRTRTPEADLGRDDPATVDPHHGGATRP